MPEIDKFLRLVEATGGVPMQTWEAAMTGDIERFINCLRERYIVEFPRPKDAPQRAHMVRMQLDGQDAFLRTAGVGLPLAEEADPNAIHPDVKREAPELGSRKPVPAPPE